jgi:hypothetical protein
LQVLDIPCLLLHMLRIVSPATFSES